MNLVKAILSTIVVLPTAVIAVVAMLTAFVSPEGEAETALMLTVGFGLAPVALLASPFVMIGLYRRFERGPVVVPAARDKEAEAKVRQRVIRPQPKGSEPMTVLIVFFGVLAAILAVGIFLGD